MTQGGFGRLFIGVVRVLYLLFLLPLGAFASCPAGLHLQNVPIGTAMPYCVKWESSSLGGCEVGCSGVCVETPATGTMGPIYSVALNALWAVVVTVAVIQGQSWRGW